MDIPSTKSRTARTRSTRNKATEALKKLPTALLLKKKAECDSRALKIVERMIEPEVDSDWLLESLAQINKAHMDDIVEERSIVKLCGYPLCDNPLKKVVNKQYQISTLRNKVYDVSRVKNFCSYRCFTAAEYLMEQMLTSPLWHREQEEIPKFQLLPKCQSRSKSPPGVEVNLVGIQLPEDNDGEEQTPEKKPAEARKQAKNCSDKSSSSREDRKISSCKNEELTKDVAMSETIPEVKDQIINISDKKTDFKDNNSSGESSSREERKMGRSENEELIKGVAMSETIPEIEDRQISEEILPGVQIIDQSTISIEKTDGNDLQKNDLSIKTVGENLECTHIHNSVRSESSIKEINDPNALNKDQIAETNSSKPASKSSVEPKKTERRKSRESKKPISFDTLTTRVENSFREWITEETICLLRGEDSEKQKILENVRTQERYAVLCKKLNHLQLEEERDSSDKIGDLKPAPEFSALQEEAKGLELKVRAFYQGKTTVDRNETKPEDAKQEGDQPEVVLPMIDIHAPKALRRRIFLDKLNRVLPDLLRALGGISASQYSYTSERCATVRALVTTFSLSSTNITFKTPEWTLVALVIIKLLAFIDPRMKYLLASRQASLYASMILMSYKLDSNYLERFVVPLITPAEPIEEISSTDS